MRKTLVSFAAAAVVTIGGIAVGTAGPASADDGILCMTTQDAPFYAGVDGGGGTNYLFALGADRGFRASGTGMDDGYGREWISGHGAEHPDREGWVLRAHTSC